MAKARIKMLKEVFNRAYGNRETFGIAAAMAWYLVSGSCTVLGQPAPGLVAAYSLNERTGSTVTDLSGNKITGTIVGASWTTGGKYGNALSFNGSTSYIDLGNPAALRLTGSMTWSAWIKTAAAPADDGQIVSKSNDSNGWQLKTSPDTGPQSFAIGITGSGNVHVQRYSVVTRSLNTWYHMAGVYDASARTLNIYVNGVLSNGVLNGTVPAAQVNSTVNVNIGRRTGGYYFNGIIDEVRIYNRALTQAEIQTDMNTPLGVAIPDTQPPSAPTNLTATAVGTTQINLGWGASTDNVGVTGYVVERCQGTGCSNFVSVATPGGSTTTFNDTGLAVSSLYRYRVLAKDAATNSSTYTNVASATTQTPDTAPPSSPGALTAAPVSTTQINLSWSASIDNVGVTGYVVERCLSAGCSTFASVATPGGSTTTLNDTGLVVGATYRYRVWAKDAAGNASPYSNTATAATLPDTQPPSAPSTLTATATSSAQINLNWGASTDNVAVTGYVVERCQGAGCSNFGQAGTPAGTTFSDTGLAAGVSYSYRVWAKDAAANPSPYSNTASATTLPASSGLLTGYPFNEGTGSTVTDLSGNNITGTIFNTTWTTAGKYGNALSFNGSASYVDLGNPAALQLTGSMTWSAWIKPAANPADDGQIIAKSNDTSGWQLKTSPDTGPQTFGIAITGSGNVKAQRYSATIRSLNTWYHVAGVYNASARTLDIYVNGALDNGVLSGTVPAAQVIPTVNVNIGRRTGGSGYYFNGVIDDVRIYNRALSQSEIQSDMNTPLGVVDTQPPAAPSNPTATAVSSTQINLSWGVSTDNVGVAGYVVERCQGAGCGNFSQAGTPAGNTFSDTGLAPNTPYSYRIWARDAASNPSPYSVVVGAATLSVDTTPPSAPGTLTAAPITGTQINLSWGPATDDVGVTSYRLERCPGAPCAPADFARIGNPTGTTYSDTGLSANTTYSYQVRAQDAAVNLGLPSNIVSATTLSTNPGLVSAYSFAEGSGSTVADSSGNTITGTISGATWAANGKYGSDLSFNGSSSYVDLGNPTSLQLTSSMTVSAWINAVANPGDDGQIVAKSDGPTGWQFKTSPDTGSQTFGIAISSSSGAAAQRYSTTVRSLNTWYYVAGVYNATAQTLDIYVNGALDNGILLGTVPSAQLNSAVNVNIGRRTGGFFFNGAIDEVRIYNRALTQPEIQSDMVGIIGVGASPAVNVNPTSLVYGNQVTGTTSMTQPVTVTNTGTAALSIGAISTTGLNSAEYSQTNTCTSSVPPNGSCIIDVAFTPAGVGTRTATLNILDNAPGNPHTVLLSGTGISSGLSISPRVTVLTSTRTQQFTPGSGGVTWLVDGLLGGSVATGTISATGLYTPPANAGVHTVTLTNADQSLSVNATVYVSNHPGVFTYHNDNNRTGVNANETVLTPANVTAAQFGKLYTYSLDGQSYAAPLYVANVSIPGQGTHNVVYVATEHNSVYAFDADGLSPVPLWQKSFLGSGVTTVPSNDTGECCDISPEIGITGTPVIDQTTGTLYVVAKTKEGSNSYVQRLHALDITNGAEKFNGPVAIQANVAGTGTGASGGQVPFDALRENQRPALLLSNGVVYIAWAAHGDNQPWHGWVIGYNAANVQQQTMAYNATRNGYGGGIWQSGGGPASDSSGNIFFTTGNGDFTASSGGLDYGDSVLKLSPAGIVGDFFTPHDQATLESLNEDLASAGPVLLLDQPGAIPHLLITAGKGASVYVLNRDNMGKFNSGNDSQIVQTLVNIFPNGMPEPGNYIAPIYFNGAVYFSPVNDQIQSFRFSGGLLSSPAASRSAPTFAYPGAGIAISANGTANGILWAIERRGGSVSSSTSPGVLHAYDANNLGAELYNSSQSGARDTLDIPVKFTPPLVVNGKVFVASDSQISLYGLLP